MRIGVINGRAMLVSDQGLADVGHASNGALPVDPSALLAQWDGLRDWASGFSGPWQDPGETSFECPAPNPRQVFGVGLNYRAHIEESGMPFPDYAPIFTKFPTCISGPEDDVVLSGDTVDWEVELVAVIGQNCRKVPAADAWSVVAALTVGQDISDRTVQMRPSGTPQMSLGKSLPTYGPIGPLLATPDEFDDPDSVELSCSVNGEEVQRSNSKDLLFTVPALIEYLSSLLPLLPGDLIFTGTPSGMGAGRTPPWFLRDGDLLRSEAAGIGVMQNRCVSPSSQGGLPPDTGKPWHALER